MKKFISLLIVALLATSAIILTACGGEEPYVEPTDAYLTLDAGFDNFTLVVGEERTITFDTNIKGNHIWTSADPSIAQSIRSTIRGVNLGTTTITLKIGSKTVTSTVKVTGETKVPATLSLLRYVDGDNVEELNARYNHAVITPEFSPALASEANFTFAVDNTDIISVAKDTAANKLSYNITGLKTGEATITFTDSSKYNDLSREVAETKVSVLEAYSTAEIEFTVTVPAALEDYQSVYIAGNFENWSGSFKKPIGNLFRLEKSETDDKKYSTTIFFAIDDMGDDGDNLKGSGTEADPLQVNFRNFEYKYICVSHYEGVNETFSWDNVENVADNRTLFVNGGEMEVADTIDAFKGKPAQPTGESAVTANITIEVVMPAELPATTKVYLAGSFLNLEDHWNSDYEMTRGSDNKTFTFVLQNLEFKSTDSMMFKILIVAQGESNIWAKQIGLLPLGDNGEPGTFTIVPSALNNNKLTITSAYEGVSFPS